jgi:hypothetical protein
MASERARAAKWWHYDGLGLPGSPGQIRIVLVTILVVAATIYGYTYIGPRGRLESGRTERHMTDFTVFTEAGAAFFDGRDPYRVANPRGWHYLYPPLFALLVAPLSLLDTQSQVVFWFGLNVVLTIACVGEVQRLRLTLVGGAAGSQSFAWLGGCAALAGALPFLDCMQAGQLGISILYLLLLGFRLGVLGRAWPSWFLGGLVLALPASIKLVPAVPVALLGLEQWAAVAFTAGRRPPIGRASVFTLGVATGVFLFVLAIPASVLGWQRNLDYLRVWRERIVTNERVGATANFNIHSMRNQSLTNSVYLWTKATSDPKAFVASKGALPDRPERIVHSWVRVAIGLVVAAAGAVALVLGRRRTILDQATTFGLACTASLLVSPLSWGHYYMAQVPAVACVPLWFWHRGRPGLARALAVIPVVLTWSYYIAMPYTGGLGLLGLGTSIWFLCACGLILRLEHRGAITPGRFQDARRQPGTGEAPHAPARWPGGYRAPAAK